MKRWSAGDPVVLRYQARDRGSVASGYPTTCCCVNLEAPFIRTEVGVDTRDHTLDIVASPSLEWRWKDEDELDARVEHGIDTPEFAAAVRADGKQAVELIERAASPFSEPWPDWRPDPAWSPPELPQGWADAPAAELSTPGD